MLFLRSTVVGVLAALWYPRIWLAPHPELEQSGQRVVRGTGPEQKTGPEQRVVQRVLVLNGEAQQGPQPPGCKGSLATSSSAP
jgi:hypothetical protein